MGPSSFGCSTTSTLFTGLLVHVGTLLIWLGPLKGTTKFSGADVYGEGSGLCIFDFLLFCNGVQLKYCCRGGWRTNGVELTRCTGGGAT